MSGYFPESAHNIARIRADGSPAMRERRAAGDNAGAERTSAMRGVHSQHQAVLDYVKQCLPGLLPETTTPLTPRVVSEDVVEEQTGDGVARVYRDCVLEVVADGLSDGDLRRLRSLARSLVRQLASGGASSDGADDDGAALGFVYQRLNAEDFSPETDARDAALLPLLDRKIASPFTLKVEGFADLRMDGKFVAAPESALPATEQVFRGRIASIDLLLNRKKHFVLWVDGKKGREEVPVEFHPHQYLPLLYPLMRDFDQVVHVVVKASRVQRGNGTRSSSYELLSVLSAHDVAERERHSPPESEDCLHADTFGGVGRPDVEGGDSRALVASARTCRGMANPSITPA